MQPGWCQCDRSRRFSERRKVVASWMLCVVDGERGGSIALPTHFEG
jgi:hypothetical protein